MEHTLYLLALCLSLLGLGLVDYRFKLAFGHNKRRAAKTLGISVAIFIVWDILLIAFGVVGHGTSNFSLPFTILPELPIEEILFLALLCYCTLLIYIEVQRWRRIS